MKPCVVVHDAFTGWLHFGEPRHIITAKRIDEVLPALQRMERLVKEQNLHAAGIITYEASPAFDPALETKDPEYSLPLVWFGLYEKPEVVTLQAGAERTYPVIVWEDTLSVEEYNESFRRIKRYLLNGDTYQVNYTYRMTGHFDGDPWLLFIDLVQSQDTKYACFIDTDEFSVCSASPELFFSLEKETLTSLPMKGTAPRGMMLEDDLRQAKLLHESEKNRAENLMIVDMVRNDMGRVALNGTVRVPRLFSLEKYPTLWQMTSEVKAHTTAGITEIFSALFPPASITGAPKQRTMQIIAEIESTPRGLYTGCAGYVTPDGRAQFNVAIRTVVIDKGKNRATYGVGGGIVWDSEERSEREECRIKTGILSRRTPEFSLLESVLWCQDEGFFLLDGHMDRLRSSAAYFNFACDEKLILDTLHSFVQSLPGSSPHKVRLILEKDGCLTVESMPLSLGKGKKIMVCLATDPVDCEDVFLFHKTTNRNVYDNARASCPGYDDVILWNSNREITESCSANVVVELDGELYTPPVNCGLLDGVYRAQLIRAGRVKERVLTLDDLTLCTHVYLINSVRKTREAFLS